MSGRPGTHAPRVPAWVAGPADDRTTVRGTTVHPARDPAPSNSFAPVPPWPSGMAPAHEWPLRTFLELGALPSAVPCARYHTKQVLWEWHLTEHADSAELVVSELVTNAITASRATSPDSPVRLWLLSDSTRVLILVQDDSPHPPVRTAPGTGTEGGRGLLLVEAISSRWAWYLPGTGGAGKVTWAILET